MARKDGTPTKVERYRMVLRSLEDWEPFLKRESALPGPRSNLELAEAAADLAAPDQLWQYAAISPEQAPENTPEVFLVIVGAMGLGRLAVEGRPEALPRLRELAGDPRWRVRESVAIALQRLGDADFERLIQEMEKWAEGSFLEQRAAVAGLCEPRLLKDPAHAQQVLSLLDRVTRALEQAGQRGEDFKILRQALGYAWSVAIVALPDPGKAYLERWLLSPDRDVRWMVKENLSKNRLLKMDAGWVEKEMRIVDC